MTDKKLARKFEMVKITNLTKGPVQLTVRTGAKAKLNKNITVLNLPGIGSGKNSVLLEDERYTHWIDEAEKSGLIKVEKITQKVIKTKGE